MTELYDVSVLAEIDLLGDLIDAAGHCEHLPRREIDRLLAQTPEGRSEPAGPVGETRAG